MQKLDRPMRVGRGAEYGALVLFQHLKPALNIGRMIRSGLRRQGEIGAQERCTQFDHKLFTGIAVITPFQRAGRPGGPRNARSTAIPYGAE